jgi:hypothetical protein
MTTNTNLITEAHNFRATDNDAYLEIRLADALAASEVEVARVTQERDGLTAVIENLKVRHKRQGRPKIANCICGAIICRDLAILERTPPATLAARDAEKKADGWDEGRMSVGLDFLRPTDPVTGIRTATPNPYRTPQQGEPEQ